jgi:hypothetical protein
MNRSKLSPSRTSEELGLAEKMDWPVQALSWESVTPEEHGPTCGYSHYIRKVFVSAEPPFGTPIHVSSVSQDWMRSVPAAIEALSTFAAQKQKLELRINLLEIIVGNLKATCQRLQGSQPKIVPINSFAPEPYALLKPILVNVYSVEEGFEAGWYDANIHSSGDTDEEAVGNLKGLILDFLDSFAKEPTEKLGPESKRQKAVIQEFIEKKV